jgi:hypothetical protein
MPWEGAFGCAGAAGVASRCVTLLDCLPIDFPPPRRRAACASIPANANTRANTKTQNFMKFPKIDLTDM